MAMHGDVDLSSRKHAQINDGPLGHRRAEHDVGQLGGKHGGAPAVSQGAARGLEHDVMVLLIHAHVGAVHHLHHLAVNAARLHARVSSRSPAAFAAHA